MLKMKKVKGRTVVSGLLALALTAVTCISASAVAYSDVTNTGKINGYSYSYYAGLNTSSGVATASTTIETSNGAKAPGGYMGAQARLYNASNGTLKSCNDMYYQNNSVSSYTDQLTVYSKGTYYSQGLVAIYHGSGYHIWATEPTTNGSANSLSQLDNLQDEYSVNEDGETYGSGMMYSECGEFPDLISAEGVNGKIGYVRSEDLAPTFSTPEEAVAYTGAARNGRYIPVYDLDGNCVDSFYVESADSDTSVSGKISNY